MGRTLANRDPRRNMGFLVLAGVAARPPRPVGPHQVGDEMPRLGLDPLVDGLMADSGAGSSHGEASGDELRRPANSEAIFNITADDRVFETRVGPGAAVTLLRPRVRLVSEVVAGMHRRGVAPQLS
ncbi:MAG: hypothetical protein A3J70_14210 [Elusimicrobia bacterium RIFCSPHIGHO2_02_FULL_61_10]|nr:MAG: hypothetical protein A3J70_14210 [Elusimicrobia bacterium RIFCSPHIGHO2_02_FULL_61_10]